MREIYLEKEGKRLILIQVYLFVGINCVFVYKKIRINKN
jgi:hypothetical protein